jgi:hypothetical protein
MHSSMKRPPLHALAAVLALVLAGLPAFAQGTRVSSWSVNAGFAAAHLPGTTVLAIAGQNVVGPSAQPGTLVTGGFLADTLWRSRIVAVEQPSESVVPLSYGLDQNYPNPFNPSTVVSFQVPASSRVRMVVYDLLGREVAVLVDGIKPAGTHTAAWNAAGRASGVYFYRLEASPESGEKRFVQSKKMLLVK